MGDGPFVCYKELSPPSSVLSSEYFYCFNPFTLRKDLYLATIAATVLNIYRVDVSSGPLVDEEGDDEQETVLDRDDVATGVEELFSEGARTKASLVQVHYQRLFGQAKDIKPVSRGERESDLVVLAIDEGKIVTLEFIPHENRLVESVLCHVEDGANGVGSDLKATSNGKKTYFGTGIDPVLRVSDEFQMLCVPIHGEELLFVSLEENSEENNNNTRMLCNLFKTLKLRGAVLDVCFLHGYGQPVLAVLQEEQFAVVGHAKKALHTVSLSVVAVDLRRQALTTLWKKKKLPHDCLSLLELPTPSLAHCVFVVAQNALLVVSEASSSALAMNGFASITVSAQDVQLSPWKSARRGVELDGSCWARHTPRALFKREKKEEDKKKKKNHNCSSSSHRESETGRERASDEVGLFGVLRDGSILHVHVSLPISDMPTSLSIDAKLVGETVRPSCCAAAVLSPSRSLSPSLSSSGVREVLVFVGARHGQCVLYAARERPVAASAPLRLTATTIASLNAAATTTNALAVEEEKDNENNTFFHEFVFVDVQSMRKKRKTADGAVAVKEEERKEREERFKEDEEDLSEKELLKMMREEELALYGPAGVTVNSKSLSLSSSTPRARCARTAAPRSLAVEFHKLDAVDVLGAVLHGTTTKADEVFSQTNALDWEKTSSPLRAMHTVASYIPEKECKDALVLASGLGAEATLSRVFSGVGLGKVGVRGFSGATRVFSCTLRTHSVLLVSYESKTRVLQCAENKLQSESAAQPDLRFVELSGDDAGFVTTSSTLGLAVIHTRENKMKKNKKQSGKDGKNSDKERENEHEEDEDEEEEHSIVVQALPFGVRLLRVASSFAAEHEPLQDLLLADSLDVGGLGGLAGEVVAAADFCADHVVLATNLQSLIVLRYAAADCALEVVAMRRAQCMESEREGEREKEKESLPFIEHDVVSASLFFGECVFATEHARMARRVAALQRERDAQREREKTKTTATTARDNERESESDKSAAEREEIAMYGAPLSSMTTHTTLSHNDPVAMDVSDTASHNEEDEREEEQEEKDQEDAAAQREIPAARAVLVVADAQSTLYFVDAATLSLLWSTREIALGAQSVIVTAEDDNKTMTETAEEEQTSFYIVESKLCRLRFSSSSGAGSAAPRDKDKLALLLLLHTGQLVVYNAFEAETHSLSRPLSQRVVVSLSKSLTRTVHNKRVAPHANLVAAASGESGAQSENNAPPSEATYLSTEDYLSRSMCLIPLQQDHAGVLAEQQQDKEEEEEQGKSCATNAFFPSDVVMVSGAADAALLAVVKGHDALFSLDFPETPLVNAGVCALRPLLTPHFALLATLWFEFEDLDALRNPQAAAAKQQQQQSPHGRAARQSTLGLYRVLPRQIFSVYGAMARQSLGAGQTVHKCQEMLRLTDDNTEQALLDNKKTFVMLCSREKAVPFSPTVVELNEHGEEAENNEEIGFERYFADVFKSFAQPDTSLAPAPDLLQREFRIALVQNNKVMDSFALDEKEKVLDMAVVYFTVDKAHGHHGGGGAKSGVERRVFVVVSTVFVDKHGEDTQGNGRLLLLGLDYAMFRGAEEKTHASEAETETETAEGEREGEGEGEEDADGSAAAPAVASAAAEDEAQTTTTAGESSESLMDVEDALAPPPHSTKKTVHFSEGATTTTTNKTVSDANKPSLSSAQQQFFGSIQPKLRQLWAGTGPASVVRQIPNYSARDAASFGHGSHAANNPWTNYLVATVGYILYVYKFNTSTCELDQVAFFFAQFYVTSVSLIKNYIVIGDMFNSVQLLYFREEDFSIHLIAKDYDRRVITKTEVMVDANKVGFVTADDRGNIQLFQENPKKLESLSGARLLNIGDFHVGSEVSMLLSHEILYAEHHAKRSTPLYHVVPGMPMPPPPPPPPKARRGSSFPLQSYGTRFHKQQFISNSSLMPGGVGASTIRNRRHCSVVGTMDGAVGMLVPVEEKLYKRLSLLQQIMTMLLPSALALNPKDFRAPRGWRSRFAVLQDSSSRRIVLDGCLLYRYLSLENVVQEELAMIIGASAQVLRENLYELEAITRFF